MTVLPSPLHLPLFSSALHLPPFFYRLPSTARPVPGQLPPNALYSDAYAVAASVLLCAS